MKCPDCESVLSAGFYEGVRIRFCKDGHGSFVGSNGLTRIIERHEEEVVRNDGVPNREIVDKVRQCPDCETAMVHEAFMSVVTIDRCASCSGVWLDPHELDDIQFLAEMGHGSTG
jgi:Zn-finger nucleic acid-binding protein